MSSADSVAAPVQSIEADDEYPFPRDEYWDIHQKMGDEIIREARENADSPYRGKCVGLLRGEVAIVADTVDEVAAALRAREPDRERGVFFEVDVDYGSVSNIYACEV